jgi:putative ABC transport system permease protein
MFKNYFKVALRNLSRHKVFSFINIFGLALGMTGVILILLWVKNEISYDRFHTNGKNICKVFLSGQTGEETITIDRTYGPVAADLLSRYPEVINSTRYHSIEEARLLVRSNNKNSFGKLFMERNIAAVDPAYLDMFSFPLVKGNPAEALKNPNSILLTVSMVEKYFGKLDPLGRTITINNADEMKVTGVLKNIPHNSDPQFGFLVPASYIERCGRSINDYGNTNCQIFLQLKDGILSGMLTQKIQTEYDKTLPESGLMNLKHSLFPFEDVHLYGNPIVPKIIIVYVFIALAFFILLIACINFINLSTARSMLRMKEIGLKKVVGVRRVQLIWQFLLESIFISSIAVGISVTMLEFTLPFFNLMIQNQLAIDWSSVQTWAGLILITIITGLMAGSYPAFYLSSFTPERILRGSISNSTENQPGRGRLRKILVVAQFALTIVLIINIINTNRWDKYLNELGFDKDNIIYFQNRGKNYDVFKAKLLEDTRISKVTTASHLPQNMVNIFGSEWGTAPGQQNSAACRGWVGYDYPETFKLKMITGRYFSSAYPSDSEDGIIVNEKLVKTLNMKNPVGERLYVLGKPYTILGVIQDFHFVPKVFEIKPLVFHLDSKGSNFVFIKFKSGDNQNITVARVKEDFENFYPNYPFEYQYLNEFEFKEAQIMDTVSKVITGFAVFGIIVAALGLFGLSSYLIEQRTKEIGIRKILGASRLIIFKLLTKEFFKLILIANFIAWPIAYFIESMQDQIFAYHIDFAYWMFAAAGFFSLLIAFTAVYFQVIRSAKANPVETLRYE